MWKKEACNLSKNQMRVKQYPGPFNKKYKFEFYEVGSSIFTGHIKKGLYKC